MIRLLELRTEKELSQRQMAKILNISQGTFNNWENGNTQPSIEQLIQLATFFDVSVDYLIGYADDFGGITHNGLNNEESKFLILYKDLNERTKKAILTVLKDLNNK